MFLSSWVSLRTGQNSLVAQGLGCQALTAEGLGSVPGRGTKIPQAVQPHGKEHTPHSPSTLSPLSKLPRNLLKFKTVVFIFSSYLLYTQHSLGPTLKLILIHLQRCEFSQLLLSRSKHPGLPPKKKKQRRVGVLIGSHGRNSTSSYWGMFASFLKSLLAKLHGM